MQTIIQKEIQHVYLFSEPTIRFSGCNDVYRSEWYTKEGRLFVKLSGCMKKIACEKKKYKSGKVESLHFLKIVCKVKRNNIIFVYC